jgi:hypothetical protein
MTSEVYLYKLLSAYESSGYISILVTLKLQEVYMSKYTHALFVSFILAFATTTSRADAIDWSSTLQFTADAGIESPLILFGFNPQPEPPPAYSTIDTIDPSEATRELSGIEPTPFLLYLSAEGGTFSFPPEPILDFSTLNIGFTTTGGTDLTFEFTFSPTGDGDASTGISDPLFFNPQPEPPPNFDDAFAFQFAFEGLRVGDSAAISLKIYDETGAPVKLSAVPVPPAIVLMFSGITLLLGFGKGRKYTGNKNTHID